MHNTTRRKKWLGIFSLLLIPSLFGAKVFDESKGIVIMEAENAASPLGAWVQERELPGFFGESYLRFPENAHLGGSPHSPLSYHFRINEGGSYVIDMHCAKMKIGDRTDWANDCYVRVIGDFSAEPQRYNIPDSHASINMLKTDMKYYGGDVDAWEWASGDVNVHGISKGRLDPGGKTNKRQVIYQFKAGETYTLVVSGRSKDFRLDRIVFRKVNASVDKLGTESASFEGTPPVADDCDKIINAAEFDLESNPDSEKVISTQGDASVEFIKTNSWIAFRNFDFSTWKGGSIDVLAACPENGGAIEIRMGSTEGNLLGSVMVRETPGFTGYTTYSGNVEPISGHKDLFLVFKGNEGDLFSLKSFIFRSGEPIQESIGPLVQAPAGRLAIVADGNSPDPDDISATAAALAMLKIAGLDDRLVHCSHSCDLVKARNISDEMEQKRQVMLQTMLEDTRTIWGGFEGLKFFNCRTEQAATVADLARAINASSASDPLWIVEAGEPDIIGYALEVADPSKRKFVKMITHHPVNDRSGDFFTYPQMVDFGIEIVRIPDQNGATYADITEGLQRPIEAFHWARDHVDPRMHFLWEQVEITEADPVVNFQKGKCDLSDAGIVYYWITGANVHDGNEIPSMNDVIDFFRYHGI